MDTKEHPPCGLLEGHTFGEFDHPYSEVGHRSDWRVLPAFKVKVAYDSFSSLVQVLRLCPSSDTLLYHPTENAVFNHSDKDLSLQWIYPCLQERWARPLSQHFSSFKALLSFWFILGGGGLLFLKRLVTFNLAAESPVYRRSIDTRTNLFAVRNLVRVIKAIGTAFAFTAYNLAAKRNTQEMNVWSSAQDMN